MRSCDQCTWYLQRGAHTFIGNKQIFFHVLQLLASRDSYGGLGARFRIATSTVSQIIPEVCDAIWEALSPTEMAPPTLEKWQEIENGFGK